MNVPAPTSDTPDSTVRALLEQLTQLLPAVAVTEVEHAIVALRDALLARNADGVRHAALLAADARRLTRADDFHPDFEIAEAALDASKVVLDVLAGVAPGEHLHAARHSLHRAQRILGQ